MIKNAELIRNAFTLINVYAVGESIDPEHSQFGLSKLNSVLADWEASGINLNFTPQVMDDLGATCPIPEEAELAVTYYLAFALAPHYGKTVNPQEIQLGASYYARLLRIAVSDVMRPARLDNLPRGTGLLRLRTGRIFNG
jgi:hypothetical protein